jgi:hypothetical protein
VLDAAKVVAERTPNLYEYEYLSKENFKDWDGLVEALRNHIAFLIRSKELNVRPEFEDTINKFEFKLANLQHKLDIKEGPILEMCAALSEIRSDFCNIDMYNRILDYFIISGDHEMKRTLVISFMYMLLTNIGSTSTTGSSKRCSR